MTDSAASDDSRVLVVDDHPALRAGLQAVLEAESGVSVLPPARTPSEALETAGTRRTDAAVVDVALEESDGLALCLELKRLPTPPAVVLYTALPDVAMSAKALLVGADGLVAKGSPMAELMRVLRTALAGRGSIPRPDPEALATLDGRVPAEDLAILGLRLERTPVEEIANVLSLSSDRVRQRISRLVAGLGGAGRGGMPAAG